MKVNNPLKKHWWSPILDNIGIPGSRDMFFAIDPVRVDFGKTSIGVFGRTGPIEYYTREKSDKNIECMLAKMMEYYESK